EKYFNEQFGFRSTLVRLRNQMDYSLFKKVNANGAIIGKQNYLYEHNYIKAYYGADAITDSLLIDQVKKLKYIQEALQQKGILFTVIFAPGKAAFYPEFIPDNLKPNTYHTTNIERYLYQCKSLSVNHINLHSWFNYLKNKSPYPLYSKYGIHWSEYGRNLAADSIINYVSTKLQQPLPHFSFGKPYTSTVMQGVDNDIADGMNLLFKMPEQTMAYQTISVDKKPNDVQPKLLTVADSYWWQMFNIHISEHIFSNGKFLFYNRECHTENQPMQDVGMLNLKAEVLNSNVVLLLATDANLPNLGWGFINNLYKDLTTYSDTDKWANADYINRVNSMKAYIKTQADWYNGVVKQAQEKNISVDSMLTINAAFTVDQQK
ncbi:MAG TPA: hypothetical protein PLO59_08555, partial [Bacteroidia bacterium]|nr:hypothetical protein [Bacteroidia bacterium]